jgi:hypothetical protein
MQFYWELASEIESNRLNAAYHLIKHVQNIETLSQKGDSNHQSQKEYIDYSLKRLIRGLGSPRDHARQGFAIALCELIRVFQINLNECIASIDENLQVLVNI